MLNETHHFLGMWWVSLRSTHPTTVCKQDLHKNGFHIFGGVVGFASLHPPYNCMQTGFT